MVESLTHTFPPLGREFFKNEMRRSLESALSEAKTLPAEELLQLCADLELVRVTAQARLASPPIPAPDQLLEVPEVAHRLGVSPDYVYRHSKQFPFTRREGRALRFSSAGLDAYLRRAR